MRAAVGLQADRRVLVIPTRHAPARESQAEAATAACLVCWLQERVFTARQAGSRTWPPQQLCGEYRHLQSGGGKRMRRGRGYARSNKVRRIAHILKMAVLVLMFRGSRQRNQQKGTAHGRDCSTEFRRYSEGRTR